MKQIFLWLAKAFIAGIVSLCIISIFCYFFYNVPIRYANESGTTDYHWGHSEISYRGTEGFASTKTDDKGFVNTYPNKKDRVDILVMGSSHTEGFNVAADENYTYVLNKKLDENEMDMYAYNIGISAHTIERCFNNLENAVREYKPEKYIVIETSTLEPKLDTIKKVNEKCLEPIETSTTGIIYQLQKLDFLRLAYSQYENANKKNVVKNENTYDDEYVEALDTMLEKGANVIQGEPCELIIVYIPKIEFDYNGNVVPPQTENKERMFQKMCEDKGITFINAHSAFSEMYNETKHLPRGFSNTKPGEGHTNKYGHEAIAVELFNHICGGVKG